MTGRFCLERLSPRMCLCAPAGLLWIHLDWTFCGFLHAWGPLSRGQIRSNGAVAGAGLLMACGATLQHMVHTQKRTSLNVSFACTQEVEMQPDYHPLPQKPSQGPLMSCLLLPACLRTLACQGCLCSLHTFAMTHKLRGWGDHSRVRKEVGRVHPGRT